MRMSDSLTDYATVVGALAQPFAKTSEVLGAFGVSAAELEAAHRVWGPILKRDAAARLEFRRAFRGDAAVATDETAMGAPSPIRAVLPFTEGTFRPVPGPVVAPVDRPIGDPDATQQGAMPTDITLPFMKSPLRQKRTRE